MQETTVHSLSLDYKTVNRFEICKIISTYWNRIKDTVESTEIEDKIHFHKQLVCQNVPSYTEESKKSNNLDYFYVFEDSPLAEIIQICKYRTKKQNRYGNIQPSYDFGY